MKRRLAIIAGAILIPGAIVTLIVGGVWAFMRLRDGIKTGEARHDQFQSRIAFAVLWRFHDLTQRGIFIGRAIMAILDREDNRAEPIDAQIGDRAADRGPSVGPMQVYWGTAIDLGLIPATETQEQYAARASDVNWCIDAGIAVFASKLQAADGDIADAIRRYNGGGPKADTYKADAMSYLADTYGDQPIGA